MTAITVELIGDWRKLQTTFRQVDQESQTLGKRLSATFDNVGQTFQRVGGAMTLGVTAPILAFGKASIDTASDVAESQSKVDQVFGKSAKEISAWAAGGAHDFGLAEGAALDAAGGFGNMLDQLGFGPQRAADMSQSIVELGADFASFHNLDITEVLEAQSAAFRGEYDAAQRVLPLLSAANVEQKAMEQTGKANAQALTQQEKAAATYALMLEGAGKAQGDFDRTASGLANTQRILKAQWQNIQGTLGAVLLPIITKIAGRVSEWASRLEGLNAAQAELAVKIGAVAAAIGPALAAFGTFLRAVSGIGIILSPIGLVLGALGAIAAAFVAAYKSSRPFRESIGDLGDAIKPLWNALQPLIAAISKTLVAALVGLAPVATRVAEALVPVVQGVTRFIKQLTSGKGEISGFASTVGDVFKTVRNVVGAVVDKLVEWFGKGGPVRKFLQENRGFFRETWNAIVGIIKAAAALIREIVAVVAKRVRDIWKEHGDTIKRIIRIAWDAVKEIIRGALKVIRGVIDLVTAGIEGDWGDVWRAIKKILSGVWDAMFGIVRGVARSIGTLIGNWLGGIRDRFVSRFRTIAENLSVQWFVIKLIFSNAVEAVRKRIAEWGTNFVDWWRKLPGRIVDAMGNIGKRIKDAFMDVLGKGLTIPIKLLFGGDGLGIGMAPGTGGGGLLGISPFSAVGRAYTSMGRPGDVISGYRPGARTLSGALSYHAQGRALDITPQLGIALAIRNLFKARTKELITPWPWLNVHNGSNYRYSDAVQAQHDGRTNVRHIHWAMREGGYGTVSQPTMLHILAGEAGKEDFAFVPHSKGGMARGAVTPVVNVHVSAFLDGKELDVRTEAVIEAHEEHSYVRSLMGG